MDTISSIVRRLRENRLLQERADYSEMDHDDLIKMSQQGDQAAFEELLLQYDPAISKQARGFILDGDKDEEDLKQMASIAFWDAVQKYDPKIHKHGFGAYANLIMNRKLTDELRKDSTEKRKLNSISQSLDDTQSDGDGNETTLGDTVADKSLSPEEKYAAKEAKEAIMKYMKEKLSPVELDVVRRKIAGDKVSKIAEETGMKYKSVENALMRVKNKLADYMRSRESKKVEESESRDSVEFTDEEKNILKNALDQIEETALVRESVSLKLKESYENYTPSQLDKELEGIEDEVESIASDMIKAYYDERSELDDRLDDLLTKLSAMEEYLSDEQYKKSDSLYKKILSTQDMDYEGDRRPADPYASRGLSRADFR